MRLDKILTKKYPKFSRSFWQKVIKSGLVLVNGEKVKPNYFFRPNDQLKIDWKKVKEKNFPSLDLIPYFDIKLKIIHEDKDYLIVEKPSGLLTHPVKSGREKTLVNGLIAKYPEIKEIGKGSLRPGVLHRLDKEVSGIMIFARTKKSFEHFKNEFKLRRIKKEYLALVHGRPKLREGEISLPIGRVKGKLKMTAVRINRPGKIKKIKEAKTKYKVLKEWNNFTLLSIRTFTGRTHQIRVHLKAINLPIVGDKKYGRKEDISLGRIFLHASLLGFYDLKGSWQEFRSEVPEDFKNFLTKIK